jgi:hypothetical protein
MRGGGGKGFAVQGAAGRARGTSSAGDGEGVLSLSTRLCEAGEEAEKEGVRLGSEGIDSQGPAALGGKLTGVGPDEVATDRPG